VIEQPAHRLSCRRTRPLETNLELGFWSFSASCDDFFLRAAIGFGDAAVRVRVCYLCDWGANPTPRCWPIAEIQCTIHAFSTYFAGINPMFLHGLAAIATLCMSRSSVLKGRRKLLGQHGAASGRWLAVGPVPGLARICGKFAGDSRRPVKRSRCRVRALLGIPAAFHAGTLAQGHLAGI